MVDLKREPGCPFCGSDKLEIIGGATRLGKSTAGVLCHGCGAIGPYATDDSDAQARADALALWRKRAP